MKYTSILVLFWGSLQYIGLFPQALLLIYHSGSLKVWLSFPSVARDGAVGPGYKPEGRGFDSWSFHWNFSLT
jgi:hypothetical protein